MNVQKTGRLLIALTAMTTLGTITAHAAGSPSPAKPTPAPTKSAMPMSAVTVKLGDAMLEEYHGGNPADRTTILRGGDVAQKAKSADSGKKHS
jgi:hypothetical protein